MRRRPLYFPAALASAMPSLWRSSMRERSNSANVHAAQTAADHLINLGHRRIGMLAGNLELSTHHDRLEGFRKAMQGSHLPILDECLISGDVQIEDGFKAGKRLLELPIPPSVIMASNNKLLLGVLQAVKEKGVNIPGELSVLGFDDNLWNKHFNPTLTAIAQPAHEIGRRSFELLREMIEHPDTDRAGPVRLSLPAELRVRRSTAPRTKPRAHRPPSVDHLPSRHHGPSANQLWCSITFVGPRWTLTPSLISCPHEVMVRDEARAF